MCIDMGQLLKVWQCVARLGEFSSTLKSTFLGLKRSYPTQKIPSFSVISVAMFITLIHCFQQFLLFCFLLGCLLVVELCCIPFCDVSALLGFSQPIHVYHIPYHTMSYKHFHLLMFQGILYLTMSHIGL